VNKYLICDSDLKITSLIFKSPDLNPLDYHVRCNNKMLYTPKPTNTAELKTAFASIWNDLPDLAGDIHYWSV